MGCKSEAPKVVEYEAVLAYEAVKTGFVESKMLPSTYEAVVAKVAAKLDKVEIVVLSLLLSKTVPTEGCKSEAPKVVEYEAVKAHVDVPNNEPVNPSVAISDPVIP